MLAFLAIGGSAAGVLVYQHLQNQRKPAMDVSGFDLAQTTAGTTRTQSHIPAPQSRSGLNMIKTGIPGMQFGAKAVQNVARKVEGAFVEICRANEAMVRALAQRYTRQYPIIRQYGRDWMSYPDLKRLNDDYMRGHDPVKFLNGLVVSKNFGKMVTKYAAQPPIQSFVKETIKQAPPEALSAATDFLNEEKNVKALVDNVAQSLGLPPGILGASGSKVDEKAVMNSVLKSHPDLQKAMGDQDVQKTLNAPEARKKPRDSR